MFKILCEQYKLGAVGPEGGASQGVMVLEVACVAGLPIGTPQGPQVIPIPTAVVHVVMDRSERDQVRALLDAFDAQEAAPPGEPRPVGEAFVERRCGRLQQHPSHTYPHEGLTGWCDGGSVLTDAGGFSQATDDLPDATHPDDFRPADAGMI